MLIITNIFNFIRFLRLYNRYVVATYYKILCSLSLSSFGYSLISYILSKQSSCPFNVYIQKLQYNRKPPQVCGLRYQLFLADKKDQS